jgi:serine protease Do
VGMNTAINPEANSIGFAIPVNMLRELLPRLLSEGVVRRAAIGVHVDGVDRQLQVELALPDRRGALIRAVQPDGPAAAAGLQPGDVVVEFDGKPIATPEDLRWRASLAHIGQAVGLVVLREGKRMPLSVKPAPMSGR